jgi:sec-independent protein translocase protein TatA
MFGLGTPELLIIAGIVFLVFGGKRLPEIGAGLGKAISSFKRALRTDSEPAADRTTHISTTHHDS